MTLPQNITVGIGHDAEQDASVGARSLSTGDLRYSQSYGVCMRGGDIAWPFVVYLNLILAS